MNLLLRWIGTERARWRDRIARDKWVERQVIWARIIADRLEDLITSNVEIPIMPILDAIAAQVVAAEATDAAAGTKIAALKTENTQLAADKAALADKIASLQQQVADLSNEAAGAQALADRLKAANDPLQAAVMAAG